MDVLVFNVGQGPLIAIGLPLYGPAPAHEAEGGATSISGLGRYATEISSNMIRIAITAAAFDALAATLPLGNVCVEPQLNEKAERLIWLEELWVNKLAAMRGLGESYSDVILRLVGLETDARP